MLDLWPRYRQHAELQLIVFYEENPHIGLYSRHIECNKQSCYLCYSVIRHHGVFEVDGGHQSLYFLWTIKDTISFETPDKAQNFRSALRMVCHDLELKIRGFRATQWRRLGFITANESVPNFSRISLALATNRELSLGIRAEATSVGYAIAPLSPTRSKLALVSQSHLAVIPETSPDDFEETISLDKTARADQPITVTVDSTVFLPLLTFPIVVPAPSPIAEPLVQPISSSATFSIIPSNIPTLPPNAHEISTISPDVESQSISNLVSTSDAATSPASKTTTMTSQAVQVKSNVSFPQTKIVRQPSYQHQHQHQIQSASHQTYTYHHCAVPSPEIPMDNDIDLIRKLERQSHRKHRRKRSHRSRTHVIIMAAEGGSAFVKFDRRKTKSRRRKRVRGTRDRWLTDLEEQGCFSGLIKLVRRKVRNLFI